MKKAQLKRRMVGAVVLVSLAVIFIPMMLDKRPEVNLGAVIPDRDAGPFDERLAAERPEPIHRAAPSEPAPPTTTPELAAPSTTPAVAANPAFDPNTQSAPAAGTAAAATDAEPPRAWIVQVGSFGQADNADGVAARLRAAGFDTVIEKAQVGGAPVFRVQVGPTSTEARAEQLRQQISSKLKLGGTVRMHPAG